jgi:hypothetical protein
LVSCKQTTSGRRSSSQGSSRGTRCLTELTFQVAIRTDPHATGTADGGPSPQRLHDLVRERLGELLRDVEPA